MRLLNTLRSINAQSSQASASARFAVSQHLYHLLNSSEWTYSLHKLIKRHRIYSPLVQQQIQDHLVTIYLEILDEEKTGGLSNLDKISQYFQEKSSALMERFIQKTTIIDAA